MRRFIWFLCLLFLSACGSSSTSVGSGPYSVSGRVKGLDNSAVAGATVKFTGTTSGTVTTDSDGNYVFTGVNNGAYQVTAEKSGYVIDPAALSIAVKNGSVTGRDFTATHATYTISGRVTLNGVAMPGVSVSVPGRSVPAVTTDANGYYSLSVTAGTYTVAPTLLGYLFTPALVSVTVTNAGAGGMNFTVTPAKATVSGTITAYGMALSGITVSLSGGSTVTTTTDANGHFAFSAINGVYTITPSSTAYVFTPANIPAVVSNDNLTGRNFTAVNGARNGSEVGPATLGQWTWVTGDRSANTFGSYGAKGVAASSNSPGARGGAMSWTDKKGNLWLFGGYGLDAGGTTGYLNDLWMFDGTQWTWISGGSAASRTGVFGTKGVPAASNEPGARECGSTWTDQAGNLWLFGGTGLDATGTYGYLGDFWKFDGTRWTWVSGDTVANSMSVYGTNGVASATNKPGGREDALSWVDRSGRLWMFGGSGKDAVGTVGHLNEIWYFDGTNWTWVSGTTIANDAASYGTMGVTSSSNRPWGRDITQTWLDSDGNMWFFGGCSNHGYLSDLWKFDGTNWTWMSGNTTFTTPGVYDASSSAKPGGRAGGIFWMDGNGRIWVYGGYGMGNASYGDLNDLWRFDGTTWSLVAGNGTAGQTPVYGTRGIPSPSNTPARYFGSAS